MTKDGFRYVTIWRDDHDIRLDDDLRYNAKLIDWWRLSEIPTVHQGFTADLKIETDTQRVWLERTTMDDGEHCDHHITVETRTSVGWATTSEN